MDWWTELHTNLSLAAGTLALGWAGMVVKNRTQRTTDRTEARQKDEGTLRGVIDFTALIQAERNRTDEKLTAATDRIERTEKDLRETRDELDQLKHDFRGVQATLRTAISYIRDLLAAWAQMIATPPPPIPDVLSHHVADKPEGGTP